MSTRPKKVMVREIGDDARADDRPKLYDIAEPADDATLWRYMSLTKYLYLVSRKTLVFARADLLGDPWEGAQGIRRGTHEYSAPPGQERALAGRQRVFISCWHRQVHELAAMWSAYAIDGDSVAIKTRFGDLKACLPDTVIFGRVHYIDYRKIPEAAFHPTNRFFFKRRSFRAEREVRAIEINASDHQPEVVLHELDINRLIRGVYVAPRTPDWVLDLVYQINLEHGVVAMAHRSSLDKDAIF